MGSKRKPEILTAVDVQGEFVTTNFSLQVATHAIQQQLSKRKSVVCSPMSIDAILSILALGVENSTLEQLLMVLGHGDVRKLKTAALKLRAFSKGFAPFNDEDGPNMSFVNGLWLNNRFSLKPGFQKELKDLHEADARVVDFVNQADQVVAEVNSWAEEHTKGLIKQIISRNNINNDTLLILGNALYFKGNWDKSFKSINTKYDDFNLLNGHRIRVPMMNQWYEYFAYGTSNSYQVLKMPYKIGKYSIYSEFSMYVFLPRLRNGLLNLVKEIKINANLFSNLNYVKITHISLPKFKFECDVGLKEPMEQLGLVLPFEKTCKDFSGMTDVTDEPVYVSDISQKCFVKTNESGTVAAAVTMTCFVGCARFPQEPPPPINFVADHPFMFVIREDISGAVLFVGTVLDPR